MIKTKESVAFIVIRDNLMLLEKRKKTKRDYPGIWSFPGGYIELNESPEQALMREAHEELIITIQEYMYICTLQFDNNGLMKIYYFVVTKWQGQLQPMEADILQWTSITNSSLLDFDVDYIALNEYKRLKKFLRR